MIKHYEDKYSFNSNTIIKIAENIKLLMDCNFDKDDSQLDKQFNTLMTSIKNFLENIKNWSLIEKKQTNFFHQLENSFWVIGDDRIQFDYQGKTVCFGMQLTEKESNSILKLLTID